MDPLVAVEPVDQRQQILLADVGRQAVGERAACRPPRSAAPWSARRSGSPGGRRPERRRGRAAGARSCAGRPLRRARGRAASAMPLPSMICGRCTIGFAPCAPDAAGVPAQQASSSALAAGSPAMLIILLRSAGAGDDGERALGQPPFPRQQRDDGGVGLAVVRWRRSPRPRAASGHGRRALKPSIRVGARLRRHPHPDAQCRSALTTNGVSGCGAAEAQ